MKKGNRHIVNNKIKSILYIFILIVCSCYVTYLLYNNRLYMAENMQKEVYANKQEILDENSDQDITKISNESNEQKKSYQVAMECISELKLRLKELNKKQQELRNQKEYDKYPAVRLNVDTPFFGVCSISDNKLKITKDVSTQDVASGYSIKDVVNKLIVKIPDFRVAKVIVSTKDIKISENMSIVEANIVISKLLDYIDQVESTIEFLENQTSKIFLDYIPDEKLKTKEELKKQLKNIYSKISQLDKNFTILQITNYDSIRLNKLLEDTNRYKNMYRNYSKQINKVLIDDDLFNDFKTYIYNLELSINATNQEVADILDNQINDFDEKLMLINMKKEFVKRKDNVEQYITNSSKSEDIKLSDELIKNNNTIHGNIKENIALYQVTSKDVLNYMKEKIKIIDEKMLKYAPEELNNNLPSEVIAKTEVINKETPENIDLNNKQNAEQISLNEKQELVNELYNIYSEYIKKESKFYTDNINLLLKDSTAKITDIHKYTEESTIDYTKYIYITLPNKLEENLAINDINFNVQVNNLVNIVKDELNVLLEINLKLNNIYENKMIEELKRRD